MKQPKAVLLDVDGTLIDSNQAHAEAYAEAARELGIQMDVADVFVRIGKGGDKVIPELTGLTEDEGRGHELSKRKKSIFLERHLSKLQPTRGARQFLARLRADGIKLVVATSAGKGELQKILEQAGVADMMQEATSSDDAAESKPDPDIVLEAIKRAGYDKDDVLMLGDTPYDVEAATRAGVRCVAVRSGGWDAEALAGAIAVYDDPLAILDDFDRSPFGRGG